MPQLDPKAAFEGWMQQVGKTYEAVQVLQQRALALQSCSSSDFDHTRSCGSAHIPYCVAVCPLARHVQQCGRGGT